MDDPRTTERRRQIIGQKVFLTNTLGSSQACVPRRG